MDLKFGKVNLIQGPNGVGKSAVIEALSYILTNNLDEKLEHYISWGKEEFVLETHFQLENNLFDYKIQVGNGTKKYLNIQPSDESFVHSKAAEKLAEYINPVLTLYSVISLQHKSTSILFETSSKRLEHLKSILGADVITAASLKMTEDVKQFKEQLALLKGEILGLNSIKFQYQESFDLEDIKELEQEYVLLEQAYEIHKLKSKEYERYLEDKNKYENAVVQKTEYVNKCKQLQFQIKAIVFKDEPEFNSESLIKTQKRLNELNNRENEFERYENQACAIKKTIEQKSKENDELNLIELPKFLKKNSKEIKIDIEKLEHLEISTNNELELNKKEISLIDQGKCHVCGQPYHGDKESLLETQDMLQTMIEEYSVTITKLSLDLSNLIEIEENNKDVTLKKRSLIEFIENQKAYLESLEVLELKDNHYEEKNNIETYLDQLLKLKREKEEAEKFNKNLKEQKEKLERSLYENQVEARKLSEIKKPDKVEELDSFDIKRYEELKRKITIHQQQKQELERIEQFNESLKSKEETNKILISTKEKEADTLAFKLKILENSRSLLDKEFSSELLEAGLQDIEFSLNEFFKKTYPKYSIMLKRDKKSVDFFYSPDNGETVSNIGLASGFEKQLLAIAFRVALSSLQDLGILILDEIDESAEDQNSLELYRNIMELEEIKQVFIVTHKKSTIEFLTNEYNAVNFEFGLKRRRRIS